MVWSAARTDVVDIEPNAEEAEQTRAVAELFTAEPAGLTLVAADGTRVPVPPALAQLVASGASELARGRRVVLVPGDAELTPNQAARMLGVSRPFLAKLLDDGVIPSRRLPRSRHRRIRFDDVAAFQRRRHEKRQGINEIVDTALAAGVEY